MNKLKRERNEIFHNTLIDDMQNTSFFLQSLCKNDRFVIKVKYYFLFEYTLAVFVLLGESLYVFIAAFVCCADLRSD